MSISEIHQIAAFAALMIGTPLLLLGVVLGLFAACCVRPAR